MKVEFERQSLKELKKVDLKNKKRIFRKITSLSKLPYTGKKLHGEYKNYRSLRAWPFRVIYKISNNKIKIYSIKHRQGVYK